MANVKYSTVEAARGIAASVVVLYHVSRHYMHNTGEMPFGSLFLFGHAGVDFFFVLSGFIIYLIHQKDVGTPQKAVRYTFRRIIRIYPIFWVSFCVACVFIFIGSGQLPSPSMKMINDLLLLPGDSIVGVSWSLRHEILFYAFFLILICNKLAGLLLGVVWLSLIVFNQGESIPALLISKYNLHFFMGILVAYLISNDRIKDCIDTQKATVILILGASLFIGFALAEVAFVFNGYADSARYAYGLTTSLVLFALVRLEQLKKFKAPNYLVFVGSISYSLYLMHLFGTGVANKFLEYTGLHSVIGVSGGFVIMVLGGFTAGALAGIYVEKPLLRYCRKYEYLFVRGSQREIKVDQ